MMKYPAHPGSILKHDCIAALGLSVNEAASFLGVSRPALSRVLNGRASVSPEMEIRISKAFGSRPEIWLKMQMAYDLAQAEQTATSIHIERYRGPGGELRA